MSIGKIHDKKTMLLRFHVGTAEAVKKKYYMALSNATTPIIISEQTGKYFSLGWDEIIDLAIIAGIDEQEEQP